MLKMGQFLLLTLSLGSLFLIGCVYSENESMVGKPDQKYLDDPLYCEKDADCILQVSNCCSQKATNRYNFEKPSPCPQEGCIECKRVCPVVRPKCQVNSCILVDFE
ncbi:MAG TPA: hypothetical protein VJI13_05780 [Candidatus Norongarragalinales archaeon]|nr:hypothetical protein [Candidatus Norongarragalinales archaeon]